MAMACSICQHPQRQAIDQALASGGGNRAIAKQFGVSHAAIGRHKANHLPETLLQAVQQQDLSDAIDVLGELKCCFKRINMLFDACHEWLLDPDEPARYTLAPRSHEVSVIYTEPGPTGKPVQRRERLSVLLERLEGKTVLYSEMRAADPRELILKTAGQLTGQLELVSDLMHRAQMLERIEALESREGGKR